MKFKDILWVFFISMLPIIELRGAIPTGAILRLPFYANYIAAVIGNILPVPFILIFIPRILDFLSRYKLFAPVVNWLKRKAVKNSSKIAKSDTGADEPVEINTDELSLTLNKREMPAGAFIGLLLFVMIPLPGTGAWTGSLVAALFNYPKRRSLLAVLLGVLGSGVIMCLASYGVVGFLSFLK